MPLLFFGGPFSVRNLLWPTELSVSARGIHHRNRFSSWLEFPPLQPTTTAVRHYHNTTTCAWPLAIINLQWTSLGEKKPIPHRACGLCSGEPPQKLFQFVAGIPTTTINDYTTYKHYIRYNPTPIRTNPYTTNYNPQLWLRSPTWRQPAVVVGTRRRWTTQKEDHFGSTTRQMTLSNRYNIFKNITISIPTSNHEERSQKLSRSYLEFAPQFNIYTTYIHYFRNNPTLNRTTLGTTNFNPQRLLRIPTWRQPAMGLRTRRRWTTEKE